MASIQLCAIDIKPTKVEMAFGSPTIPGNARNRYAAGSAFSLSGRPRPSHCPRSSAIPVTLSIAGSMCFAHGFVVPIER
jgi:hypothetical protein